MQRLYDADRRRSVNKDVGSRVVIQHANVQHAVIKKRSLLYARPPTDRFYSQLLLSLGREMVR